MTQRKPLAVLVEEARACRVCAADLPHEPNPVFRFDAAARIVIVGQAPGSRVHESGVPWEDDSGDRLVEWLGVQRDEFNDPALFAILPMGFCYPGKGRSGDLPPRPECAPLWHPQFFSRLANAQLTILVGQYAQKAYLRQNRERNLTETVRSFELYLDEFFPLPHPAWRSRIWMARNPWFEERVLPELRRRVREALRGDS